jgi:hypothetical protein
MTIKSLQVATGGRYGYSWQVEEQERHAQLLKTHGGTHGITLVRVGLYLLPHQATYAMFALREILGS